MGTTQDIVIKVVEEIVERLVEHFTEHKPSSVKEVFAAVDKNVVDGILTETITDLVMSRLVNSAQKVVDTFDKAEVEGLAKGRVFHDTWVKK